VLEPNSNSTGAGIMEAGPKAISDGCVVKLMTETPRNLSYL